jgi:RHS repeat-associated protein
MLSQTDGRGNTSNYVYDKQNRRIKSIDALNQTTSTSYDGVDNVIAVTDPLSHTTNYVYDGVNRLRFTTTPLGNVFEQKYDKVSNVLTKVDALGRTTAYMYDNLNRMVQMTDAIGGISTTSYDKVGNILTMTDELGRTTDYDYDLLNRRTKSTNALGYVAETVYNADGTVRQSIDAEGRITSFGYDKYGRSNKVTDPSGHVVSQTSYDAIDRAVIRVDRFGQSITYTYDDANRKTTIVQPLQSRVETYDANGNMIQSEDQSGRITKHDYDKLNREDKMVAADGGVTMRKYDAAGRLEYVRDPALNFTSYSYDADDRLTGETDPLGTRSYGYDNVGNRVEAIDRNGRTRAFKFDDLNRIVEEKWIGDGQTFTYGYDAVGNLLSEDDGVTAHDYVYDALNRVTSDQTGALKYEYQYDKVNNLTKDTELIGLNKVITSYVYDSRNLLTNLERGDQSVMFSYQADGLRSKVERKTINGETVSSNYSYDAYGRLTELKHSAGKIVLSDNLYVLDDFDRLIKEVRDGQNRQIGYDSTNQITSVAGVSNEAYTYDQNGNRLANTTDTGNRLISDGVYDYVYDAEGNRIERKSIASGEITTYQWDYRNRLTGVQIGSKSIAYSYDSQDRRIAKFVDGALVERYGHDGTNLAVVFDAAGALAHRYLYGGSIDEVLADQTPTTLNWALADRLGTVDLIVDDKGGVIDRVTFDSFGNKVSESAPEKSFRFGFTGRELDPETGLYYYRARYYDPLVGRFISVDSIGFQAGDTNLYRYVFNSPTQGIDPTGHEFDLGQSWNNFWGGVGETFNTINDQGWEIFRGAADAVTPFYTDLIAEGQKEGGFFGGLKQAGGYLGYTFSSLPKTINDFGQSGLEFGVNLKIQGEKTGGVLGFAQQVGGYAIGLPSALLTKENIGSTIATVGAGVGALRLAGTKVGAAVLTNPIVRTTLNTIGAGQGIVKIQEAAFGFDGKGKELAPEERILRLISGGAEIIVPGVDC